LIKCQDTTLVVDGKCKTIMLENCQNVKVIVNAIMANVEVINSKKISVTIKEKYHYSFFISLGFHKSTLKEVTVSNCSFSQAQRILRSTQPAQPHWSSTIRRKGLRKMMNGLILLYLRPISHRSRMIKLFLNHLKEWNEQYDEYSEMISRENTFI